MLRHGAGVAGAGVLRAGRWPFTFRAVCCYQHTAFQAGMPDTLALRYLMPWHQTLGALSLHPFPSPIQLEGSLAWHHTRLVSAHWLLLRSPSCPYLPSKSISISWVCLGRPGAREDEGSP